MTDVLTPPADARQDVRELEPWQLLRPDGSLAEGYQPSLGDNLLLVAHRLMLLSRQVDQQGVSLQRQGRLGTFSTVHGQEASVVGSALALERGRDWIVPQYRELPAMVHHGYPLERFFRYFRGDPSGNQMPEGVNILPFQISLATQIPHAVGLAWGLQHQNRKAAALVYFGDGASSEGDAHEAMNLAGVRRAPVVFWLQNNGWAISTPVSSQTAAPHFAGRAAGYGFPGVLVDGNDLFAVYEAARWAVERALNGDGPTLVEARTYRLGAHNTADDPTRYVPEEELAARRRLDPVERFQAYLRAHDLVDDDAIEATRQKLAEEVNAAFQRAESEAAPEAGQLFEHVYGRVPPRVARQRQEMSG